MDATRPRPFLQQAPPIIIKSEQCKKGRQCQTIYFYEENDLATLIHLISGFNTILYTKAVTVDLKDGQVLAVAN